MALMASSSAFLAQPRFATSDQRVNVLGDVAGPDIEEYSVGQREAAMKKLSLTENSAVRP